MNKFSILKKFIWQYKSATIGLLILNFLSNLSTLVVPILLAQTYALLFDYQSTRGRLLQNLGIPLENSFHQQLFWFGIFIVVKGIIDFFRKQQQGKLSEYFLFYLRDTLFKHHLKMQLSLYEQKGISKYLLRFSGDLSSIQRYLTKGILQFSTDTMLILMSIVFIFYLEPSVGAIISTLFLLASIPIFFINKKIRILETNRRNQKSGLLSFVNKCLINITSVKALNKESLELSRFLKRATKIKQLGVKYHHQSALLESIISTSLYGIIISIFILIFYLKQSGYAVTMDNLFIVVILLLYLRTTLLRLLKVGLVWEKGSISLQKINNLLQHPVAENYNTAEVKLKKPILKVDNITLSLEEKTILPELNFELKPKELGVILGQSGSGKSTIVKLLANLYTPNQGEIRLNEYSFEQLPPKIIRRQFSFLSEVMPLYGRQIAEAVVYSAKRRKQALEVYEEWQQEFPILKEVSFHTPLHETTHLTATQLQLLMWFRAIQSNKPFLVLEHPFQHLDLPTVKALWEKIPKNTGILLLLNDTQTIDYLNIKSNWEINLDSYLEKNSINLVTFKSLYDTIKTTQN